MKKSELRQIIREVIINEVNYAPLPAQYANRLRALGSKQEAPPTKKVGKTGLSIAKRQQIRDKIGRVESELGQLRTEFADLNFEMEQIAEPEGGREADRIGTKMEKVLNKIDKKESELNDLRRKLL